MPAKNNEVRIEVLKALKTNNGIPMSRSELAAVLHCEAHTLPLKQMKDEGAIVQHGKRGAAKYTIAATAKQSATPATSTKSKKSAV